MLTEPLALIAAYVVGSIPTGLWLGRWVGVDVRAAGSGNIGATNVGRTAGVRLGVATLLIDVLKGAVSVYLGHAASASPWIPALCGLTAFYGHIFSMFAGFKGGKGVATAAGVLLALSPPVLAAGLLVFVPAAALSRIVSLASLAAALAMPVAAVLFRESLPVLAIAVATAVTIVATHRENIVRLWQGTEPRFSARRSD